MKHQHTASIHAMRPNSGLGEHYRIIVSICREDWEYALSIGRPSYDFAVVDLGWPMIFIELERDTDASALMLFCNAIATWTV